MKDHECNLRQGITQTPEFTKKQLAKFAVNVGVRCGHDCTYCSSRAMLRMHPSIQEAGEAPYEVGYSIVDPNIAEKVARDAKSSRKRGLVQLCTTVDAWSPEAQKYDLGRRCLEAILAEPGWLVRILTKNAAVTKDFDLIEKHKDRVLVGLSLTSTPDKQDMLSVIEPHASPISERITAMEKAHQLGLRTYGMLCPLLPGIGDGAEQIDELVRFVAACGAEEVFCEPVNSRGNSLKLTEQVLREHGFLAEAEAVSRIRRVKQRSPYIISLLHNVQAAMHRHMSIEKLRFLLYVTAIGVNNQSQVRNDGAGVIWLEPPRKPVLKQ
jgi:DNA repair photolyase